MQVDREPTLDEVREVLRTGGRLTIGEVVVAQRHAVYVPPEQRPPELPAPPPGHQDPPAEPEAVEGEPLVREAISLAEWMVEIQAQVMGLVEWARATTDMLHRTMNVAAPRVDDYPTTASAVEPGRDVAPPGEFSGPQH